MHKRQFLAAGVAAAALPAMARAAPAGLRGPLLVDALKAAGAPEEDDVRLRLRAADGYAAALTVVQARAQRFIVATHLDGQAMAPGGLGPLWAIHDADHIAAVAALPLAERFASCPWALYHIGVETG